jgi:hypothetical protein
MLIARKRYQRGRVFLQGKVWYGKYREDFIMQGNEKTGSSPPMRTVGN